ncbi:molybdate ABC transporter substrate-binding protein [Sulfitobacter sp. LCG007]
MSRIAFLLAFLSLLLQPAGRAEAQLTVFAAASLREALDEAGAASGLDPVMSYAGSGAIARQIAQGAPADVVFLANAQWMDWLGNEGLLLPGTRRDLLGNALVLIGPAGSAPLPDPDAGMLLERLDGGRLAMGERVSVPAGSYAKAWLDRIGAWETVVPHLAETADVRGALAFVALGEAPLGIVYATDAVAEPRVGVLWTVPEDQYPAILYPAAAVTEAGRDFLDFLASPRAAAIFRRHGFRTLGAGLP